MKATDKKRAYESLYLLIYVKANNPHPRRPLLPWTPLLADPVYVQRPRLISNLPANTIGIKSALKRSWYRRELKTETE